MDMLRQEYKEKDISKEFERKNCDKNKIKKIMLELRQAGVDSER